MTIIYEHPAELTCIVLAHKDSPFLENCLQSLKAQQHSVPIILCTSTPNECITRLGVKYQIPVLVNDKQEGIASDWNFGLAQAKTKLAVLCHQDDLYSPNFTKSAIKIFQENPGLLMSFTDHSECTAEGPRAAGINIKIKRQLIRRAFQGAEVLPGRKIRRKLLSLGNPISCPSVILNKHSLFDFKFDSSWTINLDWDAWDRICLLPGEIGYIDDVLVTHRVHSSSETSLGLRDNRRLNEDLAMFERYWPILIAHFIMIPYKLSYLSNST